MPTKKKAKGKSARVRRPGDLSHCGVLLASCDEWQSQRVVRVYGFNLDTTQARRLLRYLPPAMAWCNESPRKRPARRKGER